MFTLLSILCAFNAATHSRTKMRKILLSMISFGVDKKKLARVCLPLKFTNYYAWWYRRMSEFTRIKFKSENYANMSGANERWISKEAKSSSEYFLLPPSIDFISFLTSARWLFAKKTPTIKCHVPLYSEIIFISLSLHFLILWGKNSWFFDWVIRASVHTKASSLARYDNLFLVMFRLYHCAII